MTATATISPTSARAWMMSITLHGMVLGLIALTTYLAKVNADKPPVILELVAGPGDDYMAKAAPALGTPTGVSLSIPKQIVPTPEPPAPTPPPQEEVSPIVPAPVPVPPPVKKEVVKPAPKVTPKPKEADPATNFARQIKTKVDAADRKAKKDAAKERKKEQDRISKAEFDRMNAAKKVASAAPKGTPSKTLKKIDTKGITDGLVGGSSDSKRGAGGKALTSDNSDVLAAYDALFKINLRRAFEEERPPGLSDALKVTIEVRSNADGSLSGARVAKASGSAEFDRAVLDALRRMKMPPRPDRTAEVLAFEFTMREE